MTIHATTAARCFSESHRFNLFNPACHDRGDVYIENVLRFVTAPDRTRHLSWPLDMKIRGFLMRP